MRTKRNILCLMLFLITSYAAANRVIGQTESHITQAKRAAGTAALASGANSREPDLRRDPILISFKEGVSVRADLIGPNPADPDAILVEVEGIRRSINLDEITIQQEAKKFDEYGDIKYNDEKARLDNFAIGLQNQEKSVGFIVAYGSRSCTGKGPDRANRAKDYMVNNRGADSSRIVIVDAGCRNSLTIELWIGPSGGTAPTVSGEGIITCPKCPPPKPAKVKRPPKRKHR